MVNERLRVYEKVSPAHPDKIADRIAGAIVDYAYTLNASPKVAVEVLIGHGDCDIIIETSEDLKQEKLSNIVDRIAGEGYNKNIRTYRQDEHLARNQYDKARVGDNGIFVGLPIQDFELRLTKSFIDLYSEHPFDSKAVVDDENNITMCYSNVSEKQENGREIVVNLANWGYEHITINPLGDWTGGPSVDTGCTNRKLGSDMGFAVTGGGLHGKDLSKGDVTLNIVAHLTAAEHGKRVEIITSIGDEFIEVEGKEFRYDELIEAAKNYIRSIGGFEKFAEWGLIR